MLEQPPAFPTDPGQDMRGMTLDEHVDAIIAIVGADRQIMGDEMRAVQRLMTAIQAIASQQAAQQAVAQQEQGISDETSDFGATEGTEPLPGSGPSEDAGFLQG